jgi:hypothetical protein
MNHYLFQPPINADSIVRAVRRTKYLPSASDWPL